MKKTLLLLLAALAVPGVALAGSQRSSQGAHTYDGRANLTYAFAGTLSGYTAYDSSTSTNGSITIAVKHANRHGRILKGQTLTFSVGANTRIVLRHGVTGITDGDRGIVTIKAPRAIAAADLSTTLETAVAFRVVDGGAPPSG